jgi:hypothetical protein
LTGLQSSCAKSQVWSGWSRPGVHEIGVCTFFSTYAQVVSNIFSSMPTIVFIIVSVCLAQVLGHVSCQACRDRLSQIPNSIPPHVLEACHPYDSHHDTARLRAKLPAVAFLGDRYQERRLVPDDPGDHRRHRLACTYLSL